MSVGSQGQPGHIDHHSHILYAGAAEMINSARAHHLTELSVTEHVSQFKEARETIRFGSVHSTGRVFSSLQEYLGELGSIEPIEGMRVNRGLEVDFSTLYEKMVAEFVNQEDWDLLLYSVHEFEDGTDIQTNPNTSTDRLMFYSRWYDYLRLEQMALESDMIPFTVLSHPVRLAFGTRIVPPELDELLLDLAMTARRRRKALELNGCDAGFAPELVRRLAMACSKAGCTVSIGSDAHYPGEVARNMEKMMGLVREFALEIFQVRRQADL